MDTNPLEQTSAKICLACGLQFDGHARFCSQCGGELVDRLTDPLLGKVWGDRYEILDVLGKGGMGIVYKARHRLLDRLVAIKTLHPSMVSNHQSLARFQREAKAASSLNHPKIVSVHDFGMSPNGVPFLVMDYLEGRSLSAVIDEDGALEPQRALPIFIQVCDALNHAHKRGVVHRDLKPSNIMIVETDDEADSVRLVDFGLAKLLAQPGKLLERLSSTSEAFGSPLYMSPEQCMGQELDGRADLYALGCVMYETLTGSPPLKDENALGTIYKQIAVVPVTLRAARPDLDLSEELEAIVMKALQKSPDDRHASAAAVRAVLRQELSDLVGGRRTRPSVDELSEAVRADASQAVAAAEEAPGESWSSSSDDGGAVRFGADSGYESDVDAAQEQQYLYQLKSEESAHGPDSKGVLEIVKSLADLYSKQRKFAEAKPLYERAALLMEKLQEPDSGDMHDMWLSLGDVCIELQEYEQAKIHYGAARNAVEACYGSDHPEVARVLRALAYLARSFGDTTAVLDYLNRALEVLEKCFGKSNPMLADTLGQMAFTYCLDERDFAQAHRLYDRAISLIESASGQDDEELVRHLLGKADVYVEEERFSEARQCCLKARAIQERLFGPEHESIAPTLDRLAWMQYLQKDHAGAVDLYMQELQMQEKLGQSEEPNIVTTLLNLAFACRAAGRVGDAEQHCLRALGISDRVFGRDHFETSRVLMELAYTYKSQKRYRESEETYMQALQTRESVWGGRLHFSVADTLESLAWLKDDMGKFEEAQQHCLEAIAIMDSLPYASKSTLAARLKWLASLCETMGQEEDAKTYLKRADQIAGMQEAEYTVDRRPHEVASGKVCVACGVKFDSSERACSKCQGELESAEILLEKRYLWQLENEERILGAESQGMIDILENLAKLYREQGRYSDARPLYERLARLLPEWEDERSERMYQVYSELSHACYELQDYNPANDHARNALRLARSLYGEDEPEVALVFQLMGNIALATGRAAESKEHFANVVRISEEVFGKENPSLCIALTQLSEACCTLEEFNEADSLIDRAIIIARKTSDEGGMSRALKCRVDMAWKRRDYQKAKLSLEELLNYQRAAFGDRHVEVAGSLDTLSWICVMLEDYAGAESFSEESLSIRDFLGDTRSPEYVDVLVSLGDVCRYANKLDEAERHYERALKVSETYLGRDNPKTSQALTALGRVYVSTGRYSQAERFFQKALSIRHSVYGSDDPSVAEALEELARLFESMGNYTAAEKNYLEAIQIMERNPYASRVSLRFMYLGLAGVYNELGDSTKAGNYTKRAESLDTPS